MEIFLKQLWLDWQYSKTLAITAAVFQLAIYPVTTQQNMQILTKNYLPSVSLFITIHQNTSLQRVVIFEIKN